MLSCGNLHNSGFGIFDHHLWRITVLHSYIHKKHVPVIVSFLFLFSFVLKSSSAVHVKVEHNFFSYKIHVEFSEGLNHLNPVVNRVSHTSCCILYHYRNINFTQQMKVLRVLRVIISTCAGNTWSSKRILPWNGGRCRCVPLHEVTLHLY